MISICRGPADDKFLAAAIAGDARFIVSEDQDLHDLGHYEAIRIINAETFLLVLADAGQ